MDDLAHAIPSADLGAIFVIAVGLLALCATLFPDLRTAQAPRGILSLELAWKSERASSIVASWDREGMRGSARRSLLLDLPFIVLYVVALVAFDVLIARAGAGIGLFSDSTEKSVAAILAGVACGAGVLDLLENLGLWLMLYGRFWAARATSIASGLKWVLLVLASIVGLPLALKREWLRTQAASAQRRGSSAWRTLKPRWRSRERWFALLVAIPAYVLAVVFWRQRAIDPLTAPALLLDRSFQVLTLLLIPATVFLLCAAAGTAVYSITLIGAVGFMLGVAITLSGVIRPPHDVPAIALAVLTLVTGTWLVVRFARRIPRLGTVPARAVAFALASAVPLLQLWSNAAFLPTRTEATLSQSLDLKVQAVTGHDFRATLDYEAKNPTSARVIVIVTRLTLCRWAADEPPVFDDAALLTEEYKHKCTFYRPINKRSWVSPASSVKGSHSYTVPLDRPRVTVIARVQYARGDRLRLSAGGRPQPKSNRCPKLEVVRLEAESRVKSLAEESKYLVYVHTNRDGGLKPYFYSGPTIECPPDGDPSHLAEYFGVTDARQVLDVWLTPPKSGAATE